MALDPDTVRIGVLNHAIHKGTIRANERDAWDRLLRADLNGSIEELNKLAEQKRAVAAAVRRGNPDEVVARACSEGRFSAERAAFWRSELDRDWAGTYKLLTASTADGGLAISPMAIMPSGPPELSQAEEDAAHQRYMASNHRGAAQALGYGSSRWAVGRESHVRHFNDRG
jgi:hypothetical protein